VSVSEEDGVMGMVDGKVVVVTGAGRGIGREIALLMAAEGAKVVVNDVGAALDGQGNDATPAEEVVGLIKQRGGDALADSRSVAEWQTAHDIVKGALERFGRLDAVVNVAGILRDRMFFNMSQPEWQAVIDVHLNGTFYMSRAAAPYFRQQNSGAFVHFTSTSGLIGSIGQANYAAAKLGIVGVSNSIARDMKRFNVRSNCISPFAWSRMIGSIPTETPEQQARVDRLKAMTPDKIAPLAVFLASDAARDVTGQIFGVRRNEIFLFSQPRPIRGMQRGEGWTPQAIAEHALPAFRKDFTDLDVTSDVFPWDPV
jgi:NAD(P)-dependent dehydrogenase (short-subunit alcohol dehydrogenase family)